MTWTSDYGAQNTYLKCLDTLRLRGLELISYSILQFALQKNINIKTHRTIVLLVFVIRVRNLVSHIVGGN